MSRASSYQPPKVIKVKGATAPNGDPYIRVSASRKQVWLPRKAFIGPGTPAQETLTQAGMPLLKDEWAECRNKVNELKTFPPKPLIDRVGWNGAHFALPDGTVYSPPGTHVPVVLFRPDPSKCAVAGSLREWRKATAILMDQPLATFVLLTAFTAPILALTDRVINQGFELSGPAGVGKSTLQRVAAAVVGPTDDPGGQNYWITANATANGLEQVMSQHNDLPMILEETNLFAAGETPRSRATKLNELVFRLADGTSKRRHGDEHQKRFRFTFLTSTNEPLAELLIGNNAAVSHAATDRLLTIPIAEHRPFKVFDNLPRKWVNSSEMAARLNREINRHHGQGMRQFLAGLVTDRATRPEWVAKRLQQALATFRSSVGVDLNDGSAVRVADAFGLVYAAGKFAMRYEAVSSRLDPLTAALNAYELHGASRAQSISAYQWLLSLADHSETLHILASDLPELTDAALHSAPAIVRLGRGNRRELLITEQALVRASQAGRRILDDSEVLQALVREKDRKQAKRSVRAGHARERFFVFRLP